jgi:hypothetical protein
LLKVRIVRSHRWQHDQLMSEARPPTTFQWAGQDDVADIVIFIVPPWPDDSAPERLGISRVRDLLGGRLYLFSQFDEGVFWAPGVFVAATVESPPHVAGGFYIHPDHYGPDGPGAMIDEADPGEPNLLWSFVGRADTASVRSTLLSLHDERSIARESSTPWGMPERERERRQADYVTTLLRSKFVACPRGHSPSTHRLFETMRAGRAPVVLSDAWRPPPLVDWDACCIRIPEIDARHVPAILREREDDAEDIGRRARDVWEQRFSPRGMVHQLVESCLLLHERPQTSRTGLALAAKAIPNRRTIRRGRAMAQAMRRSRQEARGRTTSGERPSGP